MQGASRKGGVREQQIVFQNKRGQDERAREVGVDSKRACVPSV